MVAVDIDADRPAMTDQEFSVPASGVEKPLLWASNHPSDQSARDFRRREELPQSFL
jgi:hypothetical protein